MKSFLFVFMVLFSAFFPVFSANADISDGLIAYYPFNGNANDESVDGTHDGQIVGSDGSISIGDTAVFNGNGYIRVAASSDFDLQEYTLTAWFKPESNRGFVVAHGEGSGESTSDKMQWCIQAARGDLNRLSWFEISNDDDFRLELPFSIQDNEWHFVAVTRDAAGNFRAYYGNESQYFGLQDEIIKTPAPPSIDHYVSIGARTRDGSRMEDYYYGEIDDVRIYSRAMPDAEIRKLFEDRNSKQDQNYSYFLPLYYSTIDYAIGIGLSNSNRENTASVSIIIFDRDGNQVKTVPMEIVPNGQQSTVLDTLNKGWINVKSSQPLAGLCFLASVGSGVNSYMADIPFVEDKSKVLHIPHIAFDSIWDTTVYVANPNSLSQSITIEIIGLDGETVLVADKFLKANGSGEYELSELLSGRTLSGGKIILSSTDGIVAFGLYDNLKSDMRCFAGINAVAVSESMNWSVENLSGPWLLDSSKDMDAYFVFSGDGIVTEIGAFNNLSGIYSVLPDGLLTVTVSSLFDPTLIVTGQLHSSTEATLDGDSMFKIMDLSICQGTWAGTLTGIGGTPVRNAKLSVNSNGEVISLILDGTPSLVVGKMFSEGGKVVSHIYTTEPDPWDQININGIFSASIITGTYELDNGPGPGTDGTISLSR